MKTRLDRMKIEGIILEVLSYAFIAVLIASPFVLLVAAKEQTECLVKTTERGNRLHIVMDCPMIPSSAHVAPTDEK